LGKSRFFLARAFPLEDEVLSLFSGINFAGQCHGNQLRSRAIGKAVGDGGMIDVYQIGGGCSGYNARILAAHACARI
jgi:hypothetical protein